jgi:DNA-binding LacI/PurR family transcriptional regulator
MRELLYVPPGRRPATGMIGLLVPSLENPIFPALAQAMEERATEAGFASILCNTTAAAFREVDYVHMLLDRGADGMIFISCEMTDLQVDPSHYTRLARAGARLVFVNGAVGGLRVPSVGVDEREAGYLATQHLLEHGHRRIGFVAGPAHYLPTREKAAGREAALHAAGTDSMHLVAHASFSVEGGREATRRLLGLPPRERPTGLICSSDMMAIGTLMEAAALGLRVPDDLSVVGFDGIEAGAWTRPQLTTIEQPIGAIAATAITALRTLIEAPESELPHYVFRPKLLARGSTGPAPPI